jgi:CubicO group peptidase (beta-lactamase class C family)
MNSYRFDMVTRVLDRELEEDAFSCAYVEIGDNNGTKYRYCKGDRIVIPKVAPVDELTRFDIASLTKVIATTAVTLRLLEEGRLTLSDPLDYYYDCVHEDNHKITIWNLLTHTSGLPELHSIVGTSYSEVGKVIAALPPKYQIGTEVAYSCIGFILLGKILEMVGGKQLDVLAGELVFEPLGMRNTSFNPTGDNFAATYPISTTGKMQCGTVNDFNALALGGVAGNAGLFSNIDDVSVFARMLLNNGMCEGIRFLSPALLRVATANQTPGLLVKRYGFRLPARADRALGFYLASSMDHPVAELFSPRAFGHTGFTGCSLFVDPELDMYVVMMTNRLHVKSVDEEQIWRSRRRVHNAAVAAFVR